MPNLPQKQIVMHLEIDIEADVSSLKALKTKGEFLRVHLWESGVVTKLLDIAEALKESIGNAEFIRELKEKPEVSFDKQTHCFSIHREFLEGFIVQMQAEFVVALSA